MRRLPWTGARCLAALGALFLRGLAAQRSDVFPMLLQYKSDVLYLLPQHLLLAAVSSGLAVLIGIPLGVLVTRRRMRWIGGPIMQVLNLGTTIPTLAILALAMTILGLGYRSAIFGLFWLTLLPIVMSTVAGLRAVPPHLIEAAQGVGMGPMRILFDVQFPNASYVIFSGVRTAATINIGTVPLAFLIGGGGLGELIFTGIDLMEPGMLLAGAIPIALLAIIVDFLLGTAQYWLIPRGVNPQR